MKSQAMAQFMLYENGMGVRHPRKERAPIHAFVRHLSGKGNIS